MTTMVTEVLATYDDKLNRLEMKVAGLDGGMNTLVWMVGTNVMLTLLVLGKLFLLPSQ